MALRVTRNDWGDEETTVTDCKMQCREEETTVLQNVGEGERVCETRHTRGKRVWAFNL